MMTCNPLVEEVFHISFFAIWGKSRNAERLLARVHDQDAIKTAFWASRMGGKDVGKIARLNAKTKMWGRTCGYILSDDLPASSLVSLVAL